MFKKITMEVLAGVFILVGTSLGIYTNWESKKEADILEKRNSALLEENFALSKELKKTSEENLGLSKKSDRYIEEMMFFKNKDFGFLKPIFPYGFTVIKQNDKFENFVKTFGDKPFYIDFKSNIIKNKDGKHQISLNDIILSFYDSKFSGESIYGEIDVDNYKNTRLFFSLKFISKLKNINDCFRIGAIMINGEGGFLYAIGVQKDEDPSQLTQLTYDLDKLTTK